MFDYTKTILKPVYFDIGVLERYFKDPRYLVYYYDYRGTIKKQVENDNEDDYEHIEHFGLAYSRKNRSKRAIVTFLCVFNEMSERVKSHWFSYRIDKQDEYFPNEGFVKNLIHGEFGEDISIYSALLMELSCINRMCEAISITPMFREEYKESDESQQNQRPIGYHNILLPTRENYYNFINTLEKITTTNINIKTFQKSVPSIDKIDHTYKDEAGTIKTEGSVSMLSDWCETNFKNNSSIKQSIIAPLKELVKLRQIPAHKLYDNEYDEAIWNDQNELMGKIYDAIRYIRSLLANHPSTESVRVSKFLLDREHIKTY